MLKEEIKSGIFVRNIKYGNTEEILHVGIMKMESGNWVDAVIYTGKDRFGGGQTVFCKKMDDFCKEFEPVDSDGFKLWMDGVYSQLDCNVSDEWRKNYPFNVFSYTEEEVNSKLDYFRDCYNRGLSAYKALTFFYETEN